MKQIIENEIDIHFSFYQEVKEKDVYTINSSGNRQIRYFLEWLYKNSTIQLDRKYDLYQKLLKQSENIDSLILAGTRGYSKRYLSK